MALALLLLALNAVGSFGQEVIYDEALVPEYQLPDPLVTLDGERVESVEAWRQVRRPELIRLFEQHEYGTMPPAVAIQSVEQVTPDEPTLNGKAIRRQVRLVLGEGPESLTIQLLLYLPPSALKEPAPAFLGLNFGGNHTISDDDGIELADTWDRDGKPLKGTPESRGSAASRWPVAEIVDRGYALATAYYGDIDPDFDDGFKNGAHRLYPEYQNRGDNWSSLGAWAWGMSRLLDYLQTSDVVDGTRVAVIGHSRLGKATVWAGAHDERFAMVFSNNSGCGGAAIARRRYGESVEAINRRFPHWFCKNHRRYNDIEAAMPVDQHQLLSLIAPRPLYVASATEDRWADPHGEFLACVAATLVYQLLGTDGLPTTVWPAADRPIVGRISYHLRTGRHDVTHYDWQQYLKFADQHLVNRTGSSSEPRP